MNGLRLSTACATVAIGICTATCGFVGLRSARAAGGGQGGVVQDLGAGTLLPIDIGLARKQIQIAVPEGMKLTEFIRVWRNGVFDPTRSSGQVYGTTLNPWKQKMSLAILDPDALTPEPSPYYRIIGDACNFWLRVPDKHGCAGLIRGDMPGSLQPGIEYKVLDLALGPPAGTTSLGGDVDYKRAVVRVTEGVRLDLLTADEIQDLKVHPNFGRAFAIGE